MASRNDCCDDDDYLPSRLGYGFEIRTAFSGVCTTVNGSLEWDGASWRTPPGGALEVEVSCGGGIATISWSYQSGECELSGSGWSEQFGCEISVFDGTDSDQNPALGPECCGGLEDLKLLEIGAFSSQPNPPVNPPPPRRPDCDDCDCANPPLPPFPHLPRIPPPPNSPPSQPGCGTSGCFSVPSQSFSSNPVNYFTGELFYAVEDIATKGFGEPWGHSRSFLSRLSGSQSVGQGYNWQVQQWPYLIKNQAQTRIVVMGVPGREYWFTKVGTTFSADFGILADLSYDESAGLYTLTEDNGAVTTFDDFTGMFRKRLTPGG
ncbi:MAG: hypothetical protein KDA84_15620, partial [Planctomycetaceae bacterium]|nr:hypothetical protein [Planctomycetaceae bacterium]